MNGNAQNGNSQPEWAVDIRDLTFKYPGASEPTLKNITLQLKPGSRCLLVGGNGAGKTSILKLLSGKHIHHGHVEVLGRDVFHDTSLNLKRAYMGTDWGKRTVAFAGYGCALTADIRVGDMMKEEQNEFPERRQFLLDLLGVDEDWRMHQLSDGQRRRVQIFLQLLRPSEILLLDEITTDLDVLARQDFLEYLKVRLSVFCYFLCCKHIAIELYRGRRIPNAMEPPSYMRRIFSTDSTIGVLT
eukprot:gb/GECG01005082.1/.p1 GENE.gb/GECG01005082.1/~~gb/GECG01005082.1/.p1  ORF type:complete len:243 (+),score=28.59 gb/GECG01005082.1/:1-729(+)